MKLLVIDDADAVPYIFQMSIGRMWVKAGGTAETVPEVLIARNWADALRLFETHVTDLIGVVTDALIEIEALNRAPDEQHCGPAFYWVVRRFSADLPVVIYYMGGLNE